MRVVYAVHEEMRQESFASPAHTKEMYLLDVGGPAPWAIIFGGYFLYDEKKETSALYYTQHERNDRLSSLLNIDLPFTVRMLSVWYVTIVNWEVI